MTKQKWIVMMVVLFYLSVAAAMSAQDVPGVYWEQTLQEVRAIEGRSGVLTTPSDHLKTLIYYDVTLGERVDLYYFFFDGKLTKVMYGFRNTFIWDRLIVALTRKYGDPRQNPEPPLVMTWVEGNRTVIQAVNDGSFMKLLYADLQELIAEERRDADEL